MLEEGKAPAPTIDYDSSKMLVTIECADKSATLLYTTDFSDPTHENGKPTGKTMHYTAPIKVDGNMTIKAMAWVDGVGNSSITTRSVSDLAVANPVLAYSSELGKFIFKTDEGATSYYTIDKTSPKTSETRIEYTDDGFLPPTDCEIIFAYSSRKNWNDSEIVSFKNPWETFRTPMPSIVEDKEKNTVSFTFAEGAEVYHRTYVGDATPGDYIKYGKEFTVTGNTHIDAYATKNGCINSDVCSWYIDWVKADAPKMAYADNMVTLTSDVPGHVFHYTFDKPASLEEYDVLEGTNVIDMTGEDIVMAYVTAVGYQPSDVVTLSRSGEPILVEDKEYNTISFTLRDGEEVYFRTYVGEETPGKFERYSAPVAVVGNTYVEAYSVSGDDVESGTVKWYIDWVKADAPKMEYADNKVTLTSDVPGHVFHYTFDKTASLEEYEVLEGGNVIDMGNEDIINVYVSATGYQPSDIVSFDKTTRNLSAPTLTYSDGFVTITDGGNDCELLYAVFADGEEGVDGFMQYEEAVPLAYNMNVKAYAHKAGWNDSPIATLSHTAAPVVSVIDLMVSIDGTNDGAEVRYTTDGTRPDMNSAIFSTPFRLDRDCTIRAAAYEAGLIPAEGTPYEFTYAKCEAPALDADSYDGRYVTISWDDQDATTTYVLKGETQSAVYTAVNGQRIDMEGLNTVTAITSKPGCDDSETAEFTARFYSDKTRILTTAPGQVLSALSWREKFDADTLRVQGSLNAADFDAIRRFKDLSVLDLTNVNDESVPEGALVGMAKLRHLTMPSTLKSSYGTIFGENGNLRSVSFTGIEPTMPEGLLDGIDNPNLLLYTRTPNYALAVSESFPNAVYVDYAADIVISDGYPFECPKKFSAVRASYTKVFTKRTRIGDCSGWEAVVLPFTATDFRHADKGEILPFASDRKDTDLRFWMFGRGDNEWKRDETLVADIPYLVSMPNSDGYDPEYNLNGLVTFSGSNVTIPVTDLSDKGMEIHGQDIIVPTYEFEPMTEFMQAVNDIDRDIDRVPYLEGGEYVGLEQGQTRDIRPFEWYILTSEPDKAPRPIFDSSEVASLFAETAIEVWTEGHDLLILSGRDRDIRIFDLAGQLVRRIKVKAGEIHRESALTPGIYFAADRKVLIK